VSISAISTSGGHTGRWANARPRAPPPERNTGGNIIATPVLGGLHHIYNLAV